MIWSAQIKSKDLIDPSDRINKSDNKKTRDPQGHGLAFSD